MSGARSTKVLRRDAKGRAPLLRPRVGGLGCGHCLLPTHAAVPVSPQRSDPQLLAQFYYADEELNQVAAELDSLDGRKDPQRCTLLVSHFRSCQVSGHGWAEGCERMPLDVGQRISQVS